MRAVGPDGWVGARRLSPWHGEDVNRTRPTGPGPNASAADGTAAAKPGDRRPADARMAPGMVNFISHDWS